MDERIKELIDYIKMLQVALECSTDPEDIEADNLMDAIWESKMELKELGYEGWDMRAGRIYRRYIWIMKSRNRR